MSLYRSAFDDRAVPVIVVHLEANGRTPFEKGPSLDLRARLRDRRTFFCVKRRPIKAGGGLAHRIANRIEGSWKLSVSTNLDQGDIPAGRYLLATNLKARIGLFERQLTFDSNREPSGISSTSPFYRQRPRAAIVGERTGRATQCLRDCVPVLCPPRHRYRRVFNRYEALHRARPMGRTVR